MTKVRDTRLSDKQFALIAGRTLIDHVVTTAALVCDGVVLALPPGTGWTSPGVTTVVPGGPTRAASVRSGSVASSFSGATGRIRRHWLLSAV